MKYITSIFLLISAPFSHCQNIDTDEQAVFWDGTSEVCYPPLDYDFSDKSNIGEINTEIGFIIQCHIPLTYHSTELPNIKYPSRNRDEVGIPEKKTFYYRINFLKNKIQLFDCDELIETYEILDIQNGKNELVINCLWEKGISKIYLERRTKPTFRQVKYDKYGELDDVWVNKEVNIFKIRQP